MKWDARFHEENQTHVSLYPPGDSVSCSGSPYESAKILKAVLFLSAAIPFWYTLQVLCVRDSCFSSLTSLTLGDEIISGFNHVFGRTVSVLSLPSCFPIPPWRQFTTHSLVCLLSPCYDPHPVGSCISPVHVTIQHIDSEALRHYRGNGQKKGIHNTNLSHAVEYGSPIF